jgi:hypothetical protein
MKANLMTIKDVTIQLFQRYKSIIEEKYPEEDGDETSLNHLKWMCDHVLNSDMPIDKMSRWLGFVQGLLTAKKIISVEEERNFSRPLFHQAYENEDINNPGKHERKVFRTEDLSEETIKAIMNSKMDEKHNYLNDELLFDWNPEEVFEINRKTIYLNKEIGD